MKFDSEDMDLLDQVSGVHQLSEHSTTKYVLLSGGCIRYAHRVVAERKLGRPLQADERVDHKDGNGLNNARSNIRVCSHQQNMWNQGARRGSSSSYKGVSFYKRSGKWMAAITKDAKKTFLGYFDDEREAARAYNEAALIFFGEYARLNNI